MTTMYSKDPEERLIRNAMMYRLGQIKKSNQYACDIGKLYEVAPANPDSMNHFDGIVRFGGPETADVYTADTDFIKARCAILIRVKCAEDKLIGAIEDIRRDVKTVIRQFPTLAGQDNEPTCHFARYTGGEYFGVVKDLGGSGVVIGVGIEYIDPYDGQN